MKKSKHMVAIVYRPSSPNAFKIAQQVAHWLAEQKILVFTGGSQKAVPKTTKLPKSEIKKLALVVVLGGDGTYLRAIQMLDGHPIPTLGVNLGSLGFLTQTRLEDLYEAILNTLQNRVTLTSHSLLEIQVFSKKNRRRYFAVNDAVIERSSSNLINLAIFANSLFASEVKCDGLIIATPTGSTAYSLAAGGPIMYPQVSAVVVTPICPHTLTSRPIIFPDELELTFIVSSAGQKAALVIDGKFVLDLKFEDKIIVRKSHRSYIVVRQPQDNFFTLLRDKLKFGERA